MPMLAALLFSGLAIVQASSALCVDSNDNCAEWATNGECDKNPGYMRFNCQLSCETCPPSPEEVFSDLDTDGDGKVTAAELMERLKHVRKAQLKKSRADHPEADADADEAINKQMESPDQHWLDEFAEHDVDKDGNVTAAESIDYMEKSFLGELEGEEDEASRAEFAAEMKEEGKRMKVYEAARFKKADLDSNGVLNLKEFVYGRMKHMPELDELMQDPEADAARQIERLDTNKDGVVDPEELAEGHDRLHHMTHPRHLWDVLKEEL